MKQNGETMKTMELNLKFLLMAGILGLAACSSTNVKNSEDPEVIYTEAVKLIDKDYHLEAKELLDELRRRFPQSRFAVLADLRAADSEFAQERFTEAAAAYSVFVELYPKHPEADYALYRKALSYHRDSPSKIARDQTPSVDAAKAADDFVRRFPKSKYFNEVVEMKKLARLRSAEKEAYIARFYDRRDAKDAALGRWQGLLQEYPDLRDLKEAASLFREAEQRVATAKGVSTER
jgi:outer membrane protein assembly factor BamD